MDGAAARWEAALAEWAWPPPIRAAAPADPWSLGPEELDGQRRRASDHLSPADVAAREELPRRGTVLDVGCGTGASSAPLRQLASRVTGVDQSRAMLGAFADRMGAKPGLLRRLVGGAPDVRTVQGVWPDVAGEVEPADVVVAHNVLYNVTSDVAGFVAALTEHARHLVVVALTARHPLHWVNPYAEALHGIRRPSEPTADLAADVVRETTGATPTMLAWTEQVEPPPDPEAFLRVVARRSCARSDQLDELRTILHRIPPPTTREMAAIVWPGTAAT
jgi:SAM-dependent methyltransferase